MDAPTPSPVAAMPPAPPQTPAPSPARGDAFTAPVQLALLVAILGLVGFVAWQNVPRSTKQADERVAAEPVRIDINRADRGELMMLPGIGPSLADRILDYRDAHGPFEGLAELRKVSGIGPATLEKLRPRIQMTWAASPPPKSESEGLVVLAAKMPARSAKTTAFEGPVDLNRAGLAELQRLPGIGPKLAQRIVDVRTTKPFASVDEIRRVPGIGAKTLEKIRPHATVEAKATGHID